MQLSRQPAARPLRGDRDDEARAAFDDIERIRLSDGDLVETYEEDQLVTPGYDRYGSTDEELEIVEPTVGNRD